jgi:hypothetical protein
MATSKTMASEGGGLPRSQAYYDVTINVLGLRAEDEWSAVALELDIWGHGATLEALVREQAPASSDYDIAGLPLLPAEVIETLSFEALQAET